MSYNSENRNDPGLNQKGDLSSQGATTSSSYDSSHIMDALQSTENYFQASSPPQSPSVKLPRLPGPTLATFCFFLAVLLFEILGFLLSRSKVSSIMITVIGEIGVIAALPIIFTGLGGFDFKAVFSVRKIPFFTLFLCIVLGLAAQLAIICPNAFGLWLLQQIGPLYIRPESGAIVNNNDKLIFSAAALFLAPLCEETLNRGFLMAGYKRFGLVRTIIVIGILFGLFHMYPYKFIGTGLGGVILAYVCYTTGSIYASMAAHFGFNLLPTIIMWISDPLRHLLPNGLSSTLAYDAKGDLETRINGSAVLGVVIISGIGLALTLLLLRAITRRTTRERPGLVLNYFGLATQVEENSEVFQKGTFFGPNPNYAYGDYGLIYQSVSADAGADSGPTFNNSNFGTPAYSWSASQSPSYVNLTPSVGQPAKVQSNKSQKKVSLIAMWVLLLIFYCYGAYQELFLRTIGRDCEINGFQHCESKLPKTALIEHMPSLQEAGVGQLVLLRKGLEKD